MSNWETLRLTPFEALQLIVARRQGNDVAAALSDDASVSWLALNRLDPVQCAVARVAFDLARSTLLTWCRRGLIDGSGLPIVGYFGEVGSSTNLLKYWDNARQFNYVNSSLSGSPIFQRVLLSRDDIIKQLEEEEKQSCGDASFGERSPLFEHAQVGLPRQRRTTQGDRIEQAILDLRLSEEQIRSRATLNDAKLIGLVQDACAKRDWPPPDGSTILRTVGRKPRGNKGNKDVPKLP